MRKYSFKNFIVWQRFRIWTKAMWQNRAHKSKWRHYYWKKSTSLKKTTIHLFQNDTTEIVNLYILYLWKNCLWQSFKCKLNLTFPWDIKHKWGIVPRHHSCFIRSAPQSYMIITSQSSNIREEDRLFYPAHWLFVRRWTSPLAYFARFYKHTSTWKYINKYKQWNHPDTGRKTKTRLPPN